MKISYEISYTKRLIYKMSGIILLNYLKITIIINLVMQSFLYKNNF